MKKIREVIRLKVDSNLSNRKISEALKVSRPVVTKIIKTYVDSKLSASRIYEMSNTELEGIFFAKKDEGSSANKLIKTSQPMLSS